MKRLTIILVIFWLFFPPWVLSAQNSESVTVLPQVIDDKAKAKEIKEYQIKLRNNNDHKLELYAVVNDLSPTEGIMKFDEPQELDKSTSLARWLRISRGQIEIEPLAEIEIPLSIEVNLAAQPGVYHALVFFSPANNRWAAESIATTTNQARLLINLTIEEDIIEKAQLLNFQATANVYYHGEPTFHTIVQNIGNTEIIPQGNIHIYDRQGREVGILNLNEMKNTLSLGAQEKYINTWAPGKSFGKYRAKLEIEYGQKTRRDLADSFYFYILPWPWLLAAGATILIIIILFTIVIFYRTYPHHLVKELDGVINLKAKK